MFIKFITALAWVFGVVGFMTLSLGTPENDNQKAIAGGLVIAGLFSLAWLLARYVPFI